MSHAPHRVPPLVRTLWCAWTLAATACVGTISTSPCYPGDVRRWLLAVLLFGLSFQVSGLAAALGDPDCDSDCPTDASGGQCPPNCHQCSCCSLPRTIAASCSSTTPLLAVHRSTWSRRVDAHRAPAPADILHVPRRTLA